MIKCSTGTLPYYLLDCEHIKVCDLQVQSVQNEKSVTISGEFELLYM
ncbi:hypothetical protein II5_05834 [Bacillus cereus MSX-A1]|nr:hypothetical protein II5_05834 [Bacillus cereus MSX-A1]